ncbi:hypothetical protein ACFPRL_13215 [Pseudoclavibacter helvolus]
MRSGNWMRKTQVCGRGFSNAGAGPEPAAWAAKAGRLWRAGCGGRRVHPPALSPQPSALTHQPALAQTWGYRIHSARPACATRRSQPAKVTDPGLAHLRSGKRMRKTQVCGRAHGKAGLAGRRRRRGAQRTRGGASELQSRRKSARPPAGPRPS